MALGYRDAWLLAALLVARAATQTLNSTSAYIACVASPGSCTSLAFVEDDPLLRSGSLPSELGDFTALTQLVLNKVGLSGTLPSELGSLSALQRLLLANNALVGEIPSELGLLSAHLLELELELNLLTGYVPTEIGALSRLTRCYLTQPTYASRTNLLSLHANSTIDQMCRVRTADDTNPPPSPPSSSESFSSTTIEANLQARVPYVPSYDRRTFMIVIPTLFLICCGGLVHMFCVQKREEGLELAPKRKARASRGPRGSRPARDSEVVTSTLAAKGIRTARRSMETRRNQRGLTSPPARPTRLSEELSSMEGQHGQRGQQGGASMEMQQGQHGQHRQHGQQEGASPPATRSLTRGHGPEDGLAGGQESGLDSGLAAAVRAAALRVGRESVDSEKQDQDWGYPSTSPDSTLRQAPYSTTDAPYSTNDAVPAVAPPFNPTFSRAPPPRPAGWEGRSRVLSNSPQNVRTSTGTQM
ncbi:hypothetical protein T492DRAFT_231703 [Pavlovales sp. CCMP2436]|nr:hypothetical protein T492DRAFT_231703 [Pavlovales sp. CCMP2436]